MNAFSKSEFLRHINTVLITLVLAVCLWVLGETSKFRKDQRESQIDFAIANQVLIDHMEESEMWKNIIERLAEQTHPATKSRYTQSDALRDKELLRQEMYKYIEKHYQQKE